MRYLVHITFLFLFWSCQSDTAGQEHHGQKRKIYTCPMHPEIIRDKPGHCPICGMDLVEKTEEGEEINDTSLQFVLKPTNEYVMSQLKTVHLIKKELPIDFKATGVITYDTRMVNTVSARVTGRIERLYVKYKFQPMKKGDKLMDIYSKDLLTEQENYLFLLNSDADNKAIISAAENKLELAGLTKEQIADLRKTKKVKETITIYSPYNGHLHDFAPMQKSGDEMNKLPMTNRELEIHEGMYIEKGQTVFNIYSTDKVWAILNVHADRQDILKNGQKLKLTIDGVDDPVVGTVDFIEPSLRNDQKTVSARVYLDNPKGELKIGAIVKAEMMDEKVRGDFLPATSILDLGLSNIVFVKRDKLFEAKQVKIGVKTDGSIEILSGLSASEEVAENAQLLMDSEAFIRFDLTETKKNK